MLLSKDQIEEVRKVNSIEELISLAKEANITLNKETATTIFNTYCSSDGELSNDELDNVAGGTCYSDGVTCPDDCDYEESRGKNRQYVIVTAGNSCDKSPYNCDHCGWCFSIKLTMYCAARWKGHDTLVYDNAGNAMHYTYD